VETGKVFVCEGIPHHLLDFRSPRGKYNVSHFQKDCPEKIEQIVKRGKTPIICGGTGFWISAVVDGISLPQVAPNEKLRKKLGKKTNGELLTILEKLDPHRAKTVDQKNKIRLIRAIEICKAIGKVPSLPLSISPSDRGRDSEFLQIGIDWPQEVLDQKIKKRLESRWTDGMIAEVENLRKKYGLSWKKIQSFGLAYFWIPLFLQGKIDKEQLKEKVFLAERGYAKRQRTWFKRDKRIIWENDLGKIEKLVRDFLK
jgi:tRNA dimethylallyltransferase